MRIAAVCKMVASRSHWVIHGVWLVLLAIVICGNMIFDYFHVRAADLRLLLSENSVAVNLARTELDSVTALLDAAENLVEECCHDKGMLEERLIGLARRHPFVARLEVGYGNELVAAVGETPTDAADLVFTRASMLENRTPITVTLVLSGCFWTQRMAVAFAAADAEVAVYTAAGRPLLPFANVDAAEERVLVAAIQGMSVDAVSLNVPPVTLRAAARDLALRQVAAPFAVDGPLVVGAVLSASHAHTHWRGNLLVQGLAWLAAAIISTTLLLLEARSRRRSELAAEKMHEDVQARDKFISVLMEHAPIMVSYWDAQCQCRYANRMYRTWFGKSPEQMERLNVKDLLGPRLYEECAPLIAASLRGEPQQFEQERPRADGAPGYVLTRYIPDADASGVKGFFVIASDITDLKQAQIKLEKRIEDLHAMATIDSLTGLDNRRSLLEKIHLEIDRAKRYGLAAGFLMLDLDHFKHVNDTYGHDAGDRVLQQVSALLQETMRASDHVGRLGGEEFGILLTNTSPERAYSIAERLRCLVEELVVRHQDATIRMTVSIGVADLLVEVEKPLEDMMKRADVALYKAKNSGRNRVCLADNLQGPDASVRTAGGE